jgi:hypothetical protein
MVTNAGGDASNEPIRNNHREHPIRSTYKSVILHSGTSDVGAVQRRNSGKDLKSSIGGSSVVFHTSNLCPAYSSRVLPRILRSLNPAPGSKHALQSTQVRSMLAHDPKASRIDRLLPNRCPLCGTATPCSASAQRPHRRYRRHCGPTKQALGTQ